MRDFPKILKKERELIGLTQQEMAKELGIPLNTYRNYEAISKNHCEPNIEMLCKIADKLKVSVGYLVGHE